MVFEIKTVLGLLRAFPAIVIYGFGIIGTVLTNKRMLIFTVILLITDLFNWCLKNIYLDHYIKIGKIYL